MHFLEATQQKTRRSLKIGILGSRGIPNRYGGFEQFVHFLAQGLVEKGHKVFVYQSSLHPYEKKIWNQVELIRKWDPENFLGSFGQFVYDFLSILDAKRRGFDLLFQLGYTSNAIFFPIWPKYCPNLIHMDGLEWKRSKYNALVQVFLKKMEGVAARNGDYLIADSPEIKKHLQNKYGKMVRYIPYGAIIPESFDESILSSFQITPFGYHLIISRFVPENNLELIIRAHLSSGCEQPLVLVGNCENNYGAYLRRKYQHPSLIFLGGIYDTSVLNNLRRYCRLYFHGHSVGGTNPSLLEAMACGCIIAAHRNPFNYEITGPHADYFSNESDIRSLLLQSWSQEYRIKRKDALQAIVREQYSWEQIVEQYESFFLEFFREKKLQFEF